MVEINSSSRGKHADLHQARVRAANANVQTVTVYQSTGTDGYSEGTWGWVLSSGGWDCDVATSFDGGHESRDSAVAAVAAIEAGEV